MTLQNLEELLKNKVLSNLPRMPWRLKFPLIATCDVDGFYKPENPDSQFPGFSAGYGKGYAYGLSDSNTTRIPLTEDYLKLYFNEEALKGLEKIIRDMNLAHPFGNCLFNLWGGTFQSFSNWHVTAQDNLLHLNTVPMNDRFFVKLSPFFTGAQLDEMHELQLEDIFFDVNGNSIWAKNGVMTCTPAPAENYPTRHQFTGTREIIGGTGKFVEATGSYHFSGFMDTRDPQRTGEPNSITRLAAWGTIEYWWPSARLLSIQNLNEVDIREFVPPLDVYQDNIVQEMIKKEVAAEEMATP